MKSENLKVRVQLVKDLKSEQVIGTNVKHSGDIIGEVIEYVSETGQAVIRIDKSADLLWKMSGRQYNDYSLNIRTTNPKEIEGECEIIKIAFDNGSEYRLPDISYEKFTEYMFKNGSSDVEYEKYLRENNMKDLTDFNSESTDEITLVIENSGRERLLKFRCVFDSDNDKTFDYKYYRKNPLKLPEGYGKYECSNCQKTSIKINSDQKKTCIGYCDYCEHPLWN